MTVIVCYQKCQILLPNERLVLVVYHTGRTSYEILGNSIVSNSESDPSLQMPFPFKRRKNRIERVPERAADNVLFNLRCNLRE